METSCGCERDAGGGDVTVDPLERDQTAVFSKTSLPVQLQYKQNTTNSCLALMTGLLNMVPIKGNLSKQTDGGEMRYGVVPDRL